jgi:hypothetical protein
MRAIRILQANWLNGEVGGDRNTVKLVRDEMAADAVRIGIAEYAPEYDRPPAQEIPVVVRDDGLQFPGTAEATFAGPEAAAQRIQELVDLTEELGLYEEPAATRQSEPEPAEPAVPEVAATKATWIKWAISQGADLKTVAGLTKTELMSRYGERLLASTLGL